MVILKQLIETFILWIGLCLVLYLVDYLRDDGEIDYDEELYDEFSKLSEFPEQLDSFKSSSLIPFDSFYDFYVPLFCIFCFLLFLRIVLLNKKKKR